MAKTKDGKYNTAYAQASAIWNKQNGKNIRPKRGTPEYDAIKKIEADIKAGKIKAMIRTKQERDANKVRSKAKKAPKKVIVETSSNPQATFEKKQVLEPEANPRPEYQPQPQEKTPDEVAFSGGVAKSKPGSLTEDDLHSAMSENRLMNKKLYKKMLLSV